MQTHTHVRDSELRIKWICCAARGFNFVVFLNLMYFSQKWMFSKTKVLCRKWKWTFRRTLIRNLGDKIHHSFNFSKFFGFMLKYVQKRNKHFFLKLNPFIKKIQKDKELDKKWKRIDNDIDIDFQIMLDKIDERQTKEVLQTELHQTQIESLHNYIKCILNYSDKFAWGWIFFCPR